MSGTPLRRRRLAAELRRLREQAGQTIEQAASKAEISKSALSRIENGLVNTRIPVLKALFDVYGTPAREAEALLDLAREAARTEWWQSYRDVVKDGFVTYMSLEAAAGSQLQFEMTVIPGLLQTSEYAEALLRGVIKVSDFPVERLLELRAERQRVLSNLSYWVIVEEGALRRRVCSPAGMIRQLQHLIDVSNQPNIQIQVIPRELPVHVGLDGPFQILTFDSPKDPNIVYIESMGGQHFLEREDDVNRLTSVFDHLRATALDFEASRRRIERIAREFETD